MRYRFFITAWPIVLATLVGSCGPGMRKDASRTRMLHSAMLLESGDSLAAVEKLEGMITDGSTEPQEYVLLASLYRARKTILGRLMAQKTLERALRRFPNEKKLMLELGRTYYEQGFYPDAVRMLEKVLQEDPADCDALFLLGRNRLRMWRRNQNYVEDLREAGIYFSRARSCDPSSWEISFHLAFTRFALGDTSGALEECLRAQRIWPDKASFPLLAGLAAFDLGDYSRCETEYEKGLSLGGTELVNRYEDISALLWGKSLERYRDARVREKREIERVYWLEHDPDPTTVINERHLEHLARMTAADLYFSEGELGLSGATGDRGMALVKFGWPRKIFYDLGERLSGRIEEWIYGNKGNGFAFVFMDEYLNDHFSIPFHAEEMKRELRDRNSISPIDSILVTLSGKLSVYTFIEDGASVDVYCCAEVDPRAPHLADQPLRPEPWILRGVLFDYQWREYEHFDGTVSVGLAKERNDSCLYAFRYLSLPFDNFHIAFAVEDTFSGDKAVMKRDVRGIEYLGDSLIVSDLVLHAPGDSTALIRFDRQGVSIAPRIGSSFLSGEKLGIYCELYNLAQRGGQSTFETTVTIYRAEYRSPRGGLSRLIRNSLGIDTGRSAVISQTFSSTSPGPTAALPLSIDISMLEPGPYELDVDVIDLVSGGGAGRTALFKRLKEGSGSP